MMVGSKFPSRKIVAAVATAGLLLEGQAFGVTVSNAIYQSLTDGISTTCMSQCVQQSLAGATCTTNTIQACICQSSFAQLTGNCAQAQCVDTDAGYNDYTRVTHNFNVLCSNAQPQALTSSENVENAVASGSSTFSVPPGRSAGSPPAPSSPSSPSSPAPPSSPSSPPSPPSQTTTATATATATATPTDTNADSASQSGQAGEAAVASSDNSSDASDAAIANATSNSGDVTSVLNNATTTETATPSPTNAGLRVRSSLQTTIFCGAALAAFSIFLAIV